MVQCITLINLNVQARVLASVKVNLAIWHGLAGEGLDGPRGLNGS